MLGVWAGMRSMRKWRKILDNLFLCKFRHSNINNVHRKTRVNTFMSQRIGKSKGRITPRTIRATSPLRANGRRGYQRANGQVQTAILMDGDLYREIALLADSSDSSVCQKIREMLEYALAKMEDEGKIVR